MVYPSVNDYVAQEVAGKIVLSLGCAGVHELGAQAAIINERSKKWYGADIDKVFVEKNKQYKLFHVNLDEDWELRIDDVEMIVITEVLEHLHSPVRTLRRIREQYPGRTLVASVPNGGSIGKFILSALRHPTYIEQDWDHLMMFNVGTLRNTLKEAGIESFAIDYYERHGYFRPLVRVFPYLAQGFLIKAAL